MLGHQPPLWQHLLTDITAHRNVNRCQTRHRHGTKLAPVATLGLSERLLAAACQTVIGNGSSRTSVQQVLNLRAVA